MIWLTLGVTLWSAVHFIQTLARPLRKSLIDSLGAGPYQLAFSLVVLISIALMVIGWRSTPEVTLYQLTGWSGPVGFLLMIIAFVLFGASHSKTAIKRLIRHPQLTAMIIWSFAHLLMNGSTRSLVLFGGLGLWALIEIPLINIRDGTYTQPESPGRKIELKGLAISAVIFVVALLLHPYFAGVVPIPR